MVAFRSSTDTMEAKLSGISPARPPELLTRISILPNSATVCWIISSACSFLPALHSIPMAFTPRAFAASTVESSPADSSYSWCEFKLTSLTTISAPSLARRKACARPIPLAAPVINATFPCNFIFIQSLVIRSFHKR